MERIYYLITTLCILLVCIGCAAGGESPQSTNQSTIAANDESSNQVETEQENNEAYPAPSSADSGYPASDETTTTDDAYPVTETQPQQFFLDSVVAGSTTVTGNGEPNIQIQVVSVSDMGEMLGSGQIDANGSFTINIGRAINPSEKIGIQPSDGSDKERYADMVGSTDIPMIGFLLDIKTADE